MPHLDQVTPGAPASPLRDPQRDREWDEEFEVRLDEGVECDVLDEDDADDLDFLDEPDDADGQLVVILDEPAMRDAISTARRSAQRSQQEADEVSRALAGRELSSSRSLGVVRRQARSALSRKRTALSRHASEDAAGLPDFANEGDIDRMPLSDQQRRAAAHLDRSWRMIPHVTQHVQIDVTDLEAQRQAYNSAGQAQRRTSMTALLVKAAATALELHPHFNASLDLRNGELILKEYVNIGVMMDLPEGLVLPVIPHADALCVEEIQEQLDWLHGQARSGALQVENLRGATFTVFDRAAGHRPNRESESVRECGFSPIIPWPQVAILGASRSQSQWMLVDGRPQTRQMLPLSLSYDQRVMNGSDANGFIVYFSEVLRQSYDALCAA